MDPVIIGIGGPVGAGKTQLIERISRAMADEISMAAITPSTASAARSGVQGPGGRSRPRCTASSHSTPGFTKSRKLNVEPSPCNPASAMKPAAGPSRPR